MSRSSKVSSVKTVHFLRDNKFLCHFHQFITFLTALTVLTLSSWNTHKHFGSGKRVYSTDRRVGRSYRQGYVYPDFSVMSEQEGNSAQ